jgi:hypothetical protein
MPAACSRPRPSCHSAACGIGSQNRIAAQRPAGRAVEQHRKGLGIAVGQPPQAVGPGRNRPHRQTCPGFAPAPPVPPARKSARPAAAARSAAAEAPEHERTVGAAETEGVRHRDVDSHRPRAVGHVVEVAVRIGVLIVRGRRGDPSRIASTLKMASTTPAAPSRCPVIDLVELTASFFACSPKARLIAMVSALSPSGSRSHAHSGIAPGRH